MTESSTTPPVVLVVEDEALVRMLAVDVLEEAGFEVIEAPSADYAVLVLDKRRRHPRGVHGRRHARSAERLPARSAHPGSPSPREGHHWIRKVPTRS